MKKILKNLATTTALICSLSSSAFASSAADEAASGQYRAAASNLAHQIRILIDTVQSNFKTGKDDSDSEPCKTYATSLSDTGFMISEGNNPYIKKAALQNACTIELFLPDSTGTVGASKNNAGTSTGAALPIPPAWFGKTIVMVPIYDTADTTISAWECATDIPNTTEKIVGQNKIATGTEGTPSALATFSNNSILGRCVYSAAPQAK